MDTKKDEIQECIDHLTTFVAKLAPDGTILMVNAAATELVDTPAHDLIGQKIWETSLCLNADIEQSEIQESIKSTASGISTHLEFTYRTPEECYVILDFSLQPVLDQNGLPIYILVEGRDISDRRRAEAALRESEERFRSIFEHAPIGIFQSTTDGRFIITNTTMAKSFGYESPDEIMAAIPIHFEESLMVDPERWQSILRTVIGADGFCRFENVHRRKDGSTFIANLYIRAVREGERVALLEGFEEDITERVLAEQRLSDANKLSETIINSFPGVFYMINEQGEIIWWNDYWEKTFVGAIGEQECADVLSYVFEADKPLAAAAIQQVFAGTQTSVELRLRHKDGKIRDYYCTGAQVNISGEPRLIGIAIDITERKRAEDEKRLFYRETIKSITQGRLDLVSNEEIQNFLAETGFLLEIARPADITAARKELEPYYDSKGLHEDALKLFVCGIGEAMTNAIKHAGSGRVYAGTENGYVWAAVSDAGPGIGALTLPGATLRRGFSTKISLGMGYLIMMESADKVYLATSPSGTTVVLVKELTKSAPKLSLDDLRDTWDEIPVY